jgi:ferritin
MKMFVFIDYKECVMIKKDMLAALNGQINAEFYSAYLYLSMAGYCEKQNLRGFGHWLKVQAHEEIQHGMKLFNYICERDETVKLAPIEAPEQQWKSLVAIFKAAYEHECKVTQMLKDLVMHAEKVGDLVTKQFLQWYLTEQVEEEASANEIFTKLSMSSAPDVLLLLDAQLGQRKAE